MHGTPLFHSNLYANFQQHFTLLNPRSPKTHHLDQQHLPHMGKIFPHLLVPLSIQFATKLRVLHSSGYSDRVIWGRVTDVSSTNCISPGVSQVGTRDLYDPCPVYRTRQSRSSVRSSGPCHTGCVNETASGPRSMAVCG